MSPEIETCGARNAKLQLGTGPVKLPGWRHRRRRIDRGQCARCRAGHLQDGEGLRLCVHLVNIQERKRCRERRVAADGEVVPGLRRRNVDRRREGNPGIADEPLMIVPLPLDVMFARFADVPLRSSVPSCTSTDAPAGRPPPAPNVSVPVPFFVNTPGAAAFAARDTVVREGLSGRSLTDDPVILRPEDRLGRHMVQPGDVMRTPVMRLSVRSYSTMAVAPMPSPSMRLAQGRFAFMVTSLSGSAMDAMPPASARRTAR